MAADQTHAVELRPSTQGRENRASSGMEYHAGAVEEPVQAERQDGQPATRPVLQPKDRDSALGAWTESAPIGLQGFEGTVRLHRQRCGPCRGVRGASPM